MEKRGGSIKINFILLILLLIFKIVGPNQPFVDWTSTVEYIANSAVMITIALIFLNFINNYIKDNVIRKFLGYTILIFVVIIIYFIFQDKIMAVSISLGILTAILIFIFQTPLLSMIGWVYLVTGRVYKEGDRISIGNIKGDVININPIHTRILEVGGDYVLADLPSGRIFTFPNSKLLSEPVSNYSKYLPYIWVAVPFSLTYETDFDFVKKKVEQIILKELKNEKGYMNEEYKKLLESFDIKADNTSLINFNMKPSQSWIEFRVIFPVNPKKQSAVITAVTQEILQMFNKYPSKVRFPRGRSR